MLTREWASELTSDRMRGFSAVNSNGLPIQFSVSTGSSQPGGLRCVAEVGSPAMSIAQRLRLSSWRLREIVELLGLQGASPAINELFGVLLPEDPQLVERWTGGLWFGFVARPGHHITLRLYVNQRWGTVHQRYYRVAESFAALGRSHNIKQWAELIPHVSNEAVPYGIAFDVIADTIGSFKIYFATPTFRPGFLEDLVVYLGLQSSTYLESFYRIFNLDHMSLLPWTILPSFEFSVQALRPVSLKVDVASSRLQTSDRELDDRILAFMREFGIGSHEYKNVLRIVSPGPLSDNKASVIQYLGARLRPGDDICINVYFCP
jgi:hypothetical protein